MLKKPTHGGPREGAGRPKLKKSQLKEKTKLMRIPLSKVKAVKAILSTTQPPPPGETAPEILSDVNNDPKLN